MNKITKAIQVSGNNLFLPLPPFIQNGLFHNAHFNEDPDKTRNASQAENMVTYYKKGNGNKDYWLSCLQLTQT